MNLSDEVDLEDFVSRPDKISAAEISAICQEAGLHAVRKNRYVVLPKDFEKGYKVRGGRNRAVWLFVRCLPRGALLTAGLLRVAEQRQEDGRRVRVLQVRTPRACHRPAAAR
jgi:hypothetical protein